MGEYQQLNSIDWMRGLNVSASPLSPESQATLGEGSWNHIISGNNLVVPAKGNTSQGADSGSRIACVVGSQYGGIRDIGMTLGSGSLIQDISSSLWFIGAGQGMRAGADLTGVVLSTNLQLQTFNGTSYSISYDAGLAQPSAPEVGIINTTGVISNSMAAKIARSRTTTGAISVASPTSAVIAPQSNQMRVTFPAAATGQDAWRVYFTFQGFGGTGIYYLGQYLTYTDIPETVVAAGVVDGIARSLAFNFQDGDLLPIEASFSNYPPPAGTHLLRLQTVMCVVGCYSNTTTGPTTSDPGAAIAISKENDYESYIPTSLVFLPEQVTSVLARPIDDYGYIGCQNGIFALQYVGNRGDELPSCTITTVLPDIGIEYAHNWCHFRGRLLIYTAQGNLIMMDEQGNFDTTFAGPVTKTLKSFTTADTAVGYDPSNDAIIVLSGKMMLFYSLQMQQWRQNWLPDFGISGTCVSAVAAQRKMWFTMHDTGDTAYSFDTADLTAPLSFVCNYHNAPGGNATVKDIYEMAIAAESGADTDFALCIAKNRQTSVFRRVSVSTGSFHIGNTDANFYAGMVGQKVLLFGADINAVDTMLFQGMVNTYISPTDITLVDMDGNPFNPLANFTELLMFVGSYVSVRTFPASGEFSNFFPNLVECRAYSVAIWFKGANGVGNTLAVDIFGSAYASSRALAT